MWLSSGDLWQDICVPVADSLRIEPVSPALDTSGKDCPQSVPMTFTLVPSPVKRVELPRPAPDLF
jgi:hypothetical protein